MFWWDSCSDREHSAEVTPINELNQAITVNQHIASFIKKVLLQNLTRHWNKAQIDNNQREEEGGIMGESGGGVETLAANEH